MSDEASPFLEGAAGNPGGWSAERIARIPTYKAQIPELLAAGLFMSEISQQLSIPVRTIRSWRASDKLFDEDCSDADSAVADQLEKEAVRRAKDGVLEPVINQGRLVLDDEGNPLMTRKYSDGLLQFLLRGRRRQVYGDKREIDTRATVDVVGAKSELARKFAAVARVVEDSR